MWSVLYYLHKHVKGNVHPRAGQEDPEGQWRYSFSVALTSALAFNLSARGKPCISYCIMHIPIRYLLVYTCGVI